MHRILVTRLRFHQPTIDYVARRTAEDKTKREIMRCLNDFSSVKIYQIIVAPRKTKDDQLAAWQP